MTERVHVPLWRWGLWWTLMGIALVVFYGLFTPVWIGLRAAGWLADRKRR